jgi:PAS domain S-box-containing protein
MPSLRLQLLISHLLLVIAMAIAMSVAISSLFKLTRTIDEVLQDDFREVLATQKMVVALKDHQRTLTDLVAGKVVEAKAIDTQQWTAFQAALAEAESSADTKSDESLTQAIRIEAERYRRLVDQMFAIETRSPELLRPILEGGLGPSLEKLSALTAALFEANRIEISNANDRARQDATNAAYRSLMITVITLGLALFLAFRLVRVALTPLALLAKQAEVIGSGDLETKVQIERRDEIGALSDSFNQMAAKLAEVRRGEVRRLQRAERMSDAALESLYDPVIVTDAKARVVHLNRAAEALFGKAPDTRRPPLDEVVADRRILKAIKQAIEGAVSDEEDERAIVPFTVAGSERKYRLRATPMHDDNGQLLGSVAVLEDITRIRELDRLKNEFIGVASHELRTPVTSLLLSIQLMEEGAVGELNEAQREIVGAQRQDLERLEKLMRDLLDITRLEAGTNPPRMERVHPSEILASLAYSLGPTAAAKGVSFVVEKPETDAFVKADRSQIGRVLINLANNAIRHTHPGGRVTVTATASKNEVTFRVEDSGEGIPPEYLKSIFERFVQVPGATQGGAGLGLSIAQTIVKAHGGVMTVESELGKGSKFAFSLAVDPNPAEDKATV